MFKRTYKHFRRPERPFVDRESAQRWLDRLRHSSPNNQLAQLTYDRRQTDLDRQKRTAA